MKDIPHTVLDEGATAYHEGKDIMDNPYRSYPYWAVWEDGWRLAQGMAEEGSNEAQKG